MCVQLQAFAKRCDVLGRWKFAAPFQCGLYGSINQTAYWHPCICNQVNGTRVACLFNQSHANWDSCVFNQAKGNWDYCASVSDGTLHSGRLAFCLSHVVQEAAVGTHLDICVAACFMSR